MLGVWAAALQSMEEDEMAAPPAGNASTILRFNFDAPSAQGQLLPLPTHNVHGYPQEKVSSLSSFRAAKLDLAWIVGRKVEGDFVIDMRVSAC